MCNIYYNVIQNKTHGTDNVAVLKKVVGGGGQTKKIVGKTMTTKTKTKSKKLIFIIIITVIKTKIMTINIMLTIAMTIMATNKITLIIMQIIKIKFKKKSHFSF